MSSLGVGLSIPQVAVRGRQGDPPFSPLSLFANSEPGFFLTASPDTCFTDTAGTTNAGPGDAVALWLDQSRGLVKGPELVTNGTFDTDLSGWINNGNAVWSSGEVVINQSGSAIVLSQFIAIVPGRTYEFTCDCTAYTSGSLVLGTTTGSVVSAFIVAGVGSFKSVVLAGTSNNGIRLLPQSAGFQGTIDNVSVRELPGAHATQATLASRPILGRKPEGGRRNLLLRTEELHTAVWLTDLSPNTVTTPGAGDGFTNIAFTAPSTDRRAPRTTAENVEELALGAERYLRGVFRPVENVTRIALGVRAGGAIFGWAGYDIVGGTWGTYTLSNIGSFEGISATELSPGVWEIVVKWVSGRNDGFRPVIHFGTGSASDLRFNSPVASCDVGFVQWSKTNSPYQRVTTRFDVTEAGKPDRHYLFFGGSADPRWMQTPTITPGTDKVQVFAGLRKLSDAARGTVAELTASTASNNGAFHLTAPNAASATFAFESKGTTLQDAVASGFTAPVSAVLAGLGDISGDSAILRIDGAVEDTETGDQGSGNYSAAAVFIGRRGGASDPFNGEISTLTARFGPNLTTEQIEDMEAFTASKVAEDTI